MRRYIHGLILTVLLLSFGGAALAATISFKTMPGDKKNLVRFQSQATLETVTGHTSNVDGAVEVNLDSLMDMKNGLFTVDLNSLESGVAMRDNDMRKQFLETDKFPTATFTLQKVISSDKPTLHAGETVKAVIEGEFKVHGVGKVYQIPVELTYTPSSDVTKGRLSGNPGNVLAVTAKWTVKLADHGINRPELLFMRLADEQACYVNLALTDQPVITAGK